MVERAGDYQGARAQADGPAPRRPLLGVCAAVAAGTLAGGLGTSGLWMAASLACLALWRSRPGPWLMLFCLAGLRAGAAAVGPVDPTTGVWSDLRHGERTVGRLHPAGPAWSVTPGLIVPGERVWLLGDDPPARLARGPVAARTRAALPRRVLPDQVLRLSPASERPTARLARALVIVRAAALERLEALSDPRTRGLCRALLLGERGALDPRLTDLFTRTGTRHVLAVSGMHVGLVALIFVWPAGSALALLAARGRRRHSLWNILAAPETWRALLLLLFAPLAGAAAPVVRASLALALGQLAPRLGGRRPDALSLWSLAASIELLAHPAAIDSPSLLLSYAATLGLICAGHGAVATLRAGLPGGGCIAQVGRLGRRRPLWGRVLSQRLVDALCSGVGLSVAATLATLPFVWSRFGEWSWVGVLLTPLMLPSLALLLLTGWLWLLAPLAGLEILLDLAAMVLVGVAHLGDSFPATPATLPPRPFALLVAACAGSLAWLRGVHRAARPSALTWGLLLLPWTRGPTGLEVWALDVGNGTAVCVRAPGEACWIFDAGSRDRPGVAGAALAPALARWDVGALSVVLSHPHRDHDGALDWVVERYPPRVWAGALPARIAARLPPATECKDVQRGSLVLSSPAEEREGLTLTLLRGKLGEGNEGSRSLRVEWGGERLLLCGDADADGLQALLAMGVLTGPHARLLLPHHGADSDWLGRLLVAADPRMVWVSASRRPPAADELERRSIPWRCTSAAGPLLYAGSGPAPAGSSIGAPKRLSSRPRKP